MNDNTPTAPTPKEIIKRLDSAKDDIFGAEYEDLISALPFEFAKPYLEDDFVRKVEAGEEEWKPINDDRDKAIATIREYMAFAWLKANDCKGLSAGRSIAHMAAFTFLAGDLDLSNKIKRIGYSYYGKPHLRAICVHYGIEWQRYDNGQWVNSEGEKGLRPEQVRKPW